MKRRMKKSKGPKKIAYELIPREPADEAQRLVTAPMYRMLDELVSAYHEELKDARIVLAWNLAWTPDVDGRVKLGQCKKASDLDRELAPYDFVILIRKAFWTDLHVSPDQRRALLDHELEHAAIKLDVNGEPEYDERGRIVYRLRAHDLEEFSCIAERYGCWKKDLEEFADALGRARQKTKGWIGFTDLHETLKDIGVGVPFDRVRGWRDAERREVMTWALLYHDARDAGRVRVQLDTAPLCLREALGPTPADEDVFRDVLADRIAEAGGRGRGTDEDPFVMPAPGGSQR